MTSSKASVGRRRSPFGSVRRLPSGRYQARYTDTRMVSQTAPQTFPTKRDADDWLAGVRSDMVRGTWRDPQRSAVSLHEFAVDHLAARADLSPRTRQLYAGLLATWIATPLPLPPAAGRRTRTIDLGAHELGALTIAAVRDWYAAAIFVTEGLATARAAAELRSDRAADVHAARAWARSSGLAVRETGRLPNSILDAWRTAGTPQLGAAASGGLQLAGRRARRSSATSNPPGHARVAQAYRLLRMLLGQAVREGRIQSNPCQISGAGQIRPSDRLPATPGQIEELAAAMPARYRAAVHLAAWSGLRSGELFGLARRHLTLNPITGEGTVRVERAVIRVQGRPPTLGATKTDSSRRTVHLPAHVVTALTEHLATFTNTEPDALVFTGETGEIVGRQVQEAFWRARARIGRPDLRWHDLRHTGATLAAHAGASLRELQHRLGHSTVNAAMIYQHHDAERDRALAERLSLLAAPASATTETGPES